MRELKNYIAGDWRASNTTFDKRSPFNGEVVATVHEATREMVDEAVRKGNEAAFGVWGQTPLKDRVKIVRDMADKLLDRVDDLIEADVADTGRSFFQARNFDGARAAGLFHGYCDIAMGLENRSNVFPGAGDSQGLWYTLRRPKGVIGAISPWNVPLLMMIMKSAPALIMGNAVLAKPSEETPSSTTVLTEVIDQSEIPDGAFSLLHGFGANSTGAFITEHPDVAAFTFTGESGTGAAIMKAAADGLREVALELGGKNAALVFDDADMAEAIDGTRRSAFFNCGQICFCTERAYVHRSRYDEFVDKIAAAARAVTIGEPNADGFSIGPLISHGHRDKVLDLLNSVGPDGGEFVAGGGVPAFGDDRDKGSFVQPSVAVGLGQDARFVTEEAFGPVLHVAPFDEEDEAISLANDTRYGLSTCIWTQNISRAHRVAPKVRVGHAWINSWQMRDLQSPLAGAGASGIGEQMGRNSLDFCSQPQTVTLRIYEG